MTEIRYECIDALETQFGDMHQELGFGRDARDFALNALGFSGFQCHSEHPNKVSAVTNNPLRGYVLANEVETNGRNVAFVFAGTPPEGMSDGDDVFLDAALMEQCINVARLNAGLVYATLYTSLLVYLIKRFRALAEAARTAGTGLYFAEHLSTSRTITIPNVSAMETLILWPKLFRRLVAFFASGESDLRSWTARCLTISSIAMTVCCSQQAN